MGMCFNNLMDNNFFKLANLEMSYVENWNFTPQEIDLRIGEVG